jgi:HEAT repeat protein
MHTARLKKLLKNLNDKDPSKRRSAAEALAEGDERAIYPLIKALRDENYGVQDAAMRSLMEIKSETTAYMVLPLLRENSFLRNTALIILREMGRIAIPLLYILLDDKDDDVRKFALDLIHDIQYCDYPEKLVELVTEDPNANVRAAAAKALGTLRYRKAVPQLVKALNDEEWVCFSVLEALGELKEESSIDSIAGLLNSNSEAIRFAAIETLGKIGSSRAKPYLMEYASRADEIERNAALKSLIQIGDIPSLLGISDSLISMLREGEWEEKYIAMKGLVSLNEKKAIYHMIDLAGSLDLTNPENEDKLYFIKEAIQNFGCNNEILNILNDDSIKYRGKVIAIEIVGNLKCKAAVPILIELLKTRYRDIRRSSIKSLSQIESKEATECLIGAIDDYDSHVRKTAVTALGKIGEPSAFEPLMKMLHKEQYSDIIDEFIISLLRINPVRFMSRIKEFDENIQEIAARHASSLNLEVTC